MAIKVKWGYLKRISRKDRRTSGKEAVGQVLTLFSRVFLQCFQLLRQLLGRCIAPGHSQCIADRGRVGDFKPHLGGSPTSPGTPAERLPSIPAPGMGQGNPTQLTKVQRQLKRRNELEINAPLTGPLVRSCKNDQP